MRSTGFSANTAGVATSPGAEKGEVPVIVVDSGVWTNFLNGRNVLAFGDCARAGDGVTAEPCGNWHRYIGRL
jgi:hypothetical protein